MKNKEIWVVSGLWGGSAIFVSIGLLFLRSRVSEGPFFARFFSARRAEIERS